MYYLIVGMLYLTPQGSWCSVNPTGARQCIFDTYEQCRNTIRGIGGLCTPAPQRY
jgi:hypothetical protein